MTGLFNLRTRLALFSALLIVVALGSVYLLAQRMGSELRDSGYQQNLGSIEARVTGSWTRETQSLKGILFSTIYDKANAAQLRAGGAKDFVMRMTLTVGAPQAWILNSKGGLVTAAGLEEEFATSADALDIARRAMSSGSAVGLVSAGKEATLVAAARLNEGAGSDVIFIGRPVDQQLARIMTELTGAQLAFYKFKAGGRLDTLGAMMDATLLSELTGIIKSVSSTGAPATRDLDIRDQRFRLTLLNQSAEGNIYAAILPAVRPVADKVDSFIRAVAMIAALALALALAGGLVFGQRLTGALSDLTKSARQISNGRYDIDLKVRSSDELGRFVESFKLLAQSLKQREAKMFQSAHRDTVTGLPSRALFENEIVSAVAKARGRNESLALITVVVDRLREVNDSLGRKASDAMLSEIGDRLRRGLKAVASETKASGGPGFIARLATYEFGIILPGADQEHVALVANKLSAALARRVEFDSQSVLPGGRIGMAVFPDHGMDPGSLLYSADIAASHAQKQLNSIALFDPSFEVEREKQLAMLGELREALERGELHVAMQPKINLQKKSTLMAEALMRWEHPERGAQNPAEFVPFAEKTGFITKLTNWMIDASLAVAADYAKKGLSLAISVNLSPRDLGGPDFTTYVVERLRAHKLRGSSLTLEVTEQAVVNASPVVRQNLDVLWRLGVKIAIDDFGSGFASIEQLRALPLSYLKIDRQYVNGLVTDEASRIVVKSSIELGHALGVEVVAEGVETTEQLEALRTLNCDLAQGYFVGKPLPQEDFEAWVQTRASSFDVETGGRRAPRRSGGKAALAAAAAAAAGGSATTAPDVAASGTVPAPGALAAQAGELVLEADLPLPEAPEPKAEPDAPALASADDTAALEFEMPELEVPAASEASSGEPLSFEAAPEDDEMPSLSFDMPDLDGKD